MSLPGRPVLFDYPKNAAFGRVLPKNKVYAFGKPSRRVRDLFAAEVAKLVWAYKLAPDTINLPAGPGVPEIQVFAVTLKPGIVELTEDVLRCIDKAIGFPILFEVTSHGCESGDVSGGDSGKPPGPPEAASESITNGDAGNATAPGGLGGGQGGGRVRVIAAFKRPSEADSAKWVVGDYFAAGWLPADAPRLPLPVALNLGGLYGQILRQLMPTPARDGESLHAHADRLARIRQLQRECLKLQAQLGREKQFNRKVEINARLRDLQTELETLTA